MVRKALISQCFEVVFFLSGIFSITLNLLRPYGVAQAENPSSPVCASVFVQSLPGRICRFDNGSGSVMSIFLLVSSDAFYVFLGLLGCLLLLCLAFWVRHLVRSSSAQPKAPPSASTLVAQALPAQLSRSASGAKPIPSGGAGPRAFPSAGGATPARRLLALVVILLACVVGLGFLLVLLPQSTVQNWAESLRLRSAPPGQEEPIALLYLGHEIQGQEFRIRGTIRNISTHPIEQLDANIRLFALDDKILETAIVPLDTELIPPDATSNFSLIYPNYTGQILRYSVGFKLRNGELVPYKDMRGPR